MQCCTGWQRWRARSATRPRRTARTAGLKVPGWHLVVRHMAVFVQRWQLRGANLAGYQSILSIFDTVAENAMELLSCSAAAAEAKRQRLDVSRR